MSGYTHSAELTPFVVVVAAPLVTWMSPRCAQFAPSVLLFGRWKSSE
ncbi:hypothetical protein GTA09_21380 [Rhodococcus hoagii]|nr:hypothetical protein [Prescottella equi]